MPPLCLLLNVGITNEKCLHHINTVLITPALQISHIWSTFFKICKPLSNTTLSCQITQCCEKPTWYSVQKNTVKHKQERFEEFILPSQLGSLNSLGRLPTAITPACYSFQTVVNRGRGDVSFLPWILAAGTDTTVARRSFTWVFSKAAAFTYWQTGAFPVRLQFLTTCSFPLVTCTCMRWGVVTPVTAPSLRVNRLIPDVRNWIFFFYPLSNWKTQPLSSPQVWYKC